MSIDTAHFQEELEQVRGRILKTIEHHDIGTASLEEETGDMLSGSADNHMADTATETYERELDEGLEEDAREQLRQVEKALDADRVRRVRSLRDLRQGDPGRTARGRALDDALHRRREAAGPLRKGRR